MRAVEDDHVDRPGVQARQRVELTGTNRSIGLIPLMVHVRGRVRKDRFACRCDLKGAIPGALSPETLPSVALSLAGPVTGARRLNPIPSRTRPLNASALMVLCLKTRESRSSPGQPRTSPFSHEREPFNNHLIFVGGRPICRPAVAGDAGCTRTRSAMAVPNPKRSLKKGARFFSGQAIRLSGRRDPGPAAEAYAA